MLCTANVPSLSLLGNCWQLRDAPTELSAAVSQAPGPSWMQGYLQARGLHSAPLLSRYLRPSLQDLAAQDPTAIADMPAAVDRLLSALQKKQRVVIYGDYDVDGVCATALLLEFLRREGGEVDFYIPHRRHEGYGPNVAAFAELSERAELIVTVDCGSSALEEVAVARARGVDTLIVDHHQVPAELPAAVACLNPQRPDCSYPYKGLCATGVAFMLAMCLRRARREAGAYAGGSQPDLRPLLDLVALATIADMMPLSGVNRSLVACGLQRLRTNPRPGLQALCAVAKVSVANVDAAAVGFKLGPRLNASGRMQAARPAVELLLCRDLQAARPLAQQLDDANLARRTLQKDIERQALAQVEARHFDDDAALVVEDPSWHPGVLGLVASRLAGHYHRPCLVVGEGGKGSGRSVGDFDLHGALQACAPHLQRFGGHRAAAGVTVAADKVAALRADLATHAADARGAPPYPRTLRPDAQLDAANLDAHTLQALACLEPFGQANPQPLFWARHLQVVGRRVVGGEHLKLELHGGAEAIGFGMGHLLSQLPTTMDGAGWLELNRFGRQQSVQLRLCDLRAS